MDLKEQYDKLLRYCYAKTKDRYLAEDIVQESFLLFWQSKTYKDTGKEMAYLYTIARNLCVDEYKKPSHVDIDDCLIALNDDIEKQIEQCQLEEAMDQLDDEMREIVILRYANGLKVSDIAQILGLSRFAVTRRQKMALSILKDYMEGDIRK